MKRTSVKLTDQQQSVIRQISESTNRNQSTVISDIINKVTASGVYDREQKLFSAGRPLRRLTESARFIEQPSATVAYTYAGALSYLEQDKMIALATQLYSQNPLAHRVIEIIADFCVGDEITYDADDPDVNKEISRFWTHPRNNFQATQHQRVTELLLYGEQCYPVFVDPNDGLLQLGNIHPSYIKQTILDPDSYTFVIGVEVYAAYPTTKTYRTIYALDPKLFLNDPALKLRSEMTGDCFYFPINTLSLPMTANGVNERAYQIRGRSELLPVMDRLGMLDDLTYLNLDRVQMLLSIIYDITIKQGTVKDIENILTEFDIPSGPAVRAHDENMEINMKIPNLGASDTATLFKTLQDEILGCIGIPSQWFGDSGNANRSTAQSMELPTLKKLKSRQRVISDMFTSILNYQMELFKKKRTLPMEASYALNVPAITRRDLVVTGDAMTKFVPNLISAVQQRWIPNSKAGEMYREVAGSTGVELDAAEGIDLIDRNILEQLKNANQPITTPNITPLTQPNDVQNVNQDYIAVDNPDEPRSEKEERDLQNRISEKEL